MAIRSAFAYLVKLFSLIYYLGIVGGFTYLLYSYLYCDFRVANVFANCHVEQPTFFKICALWGNHEGSMLLWCLVLAFFGWLVCVRASSSNQNFLELYSKETRGTNHRLQPHLVLLLGINFFFVCFIIFTSNPFLFDNYTPLVGRELNPILQDPVLAIHPPMIYLGYLGMVVPYVYSLCYPRLIGGNSVLEGPWSVLNRSFVREDFYKFTLFAWVLLTTGIVLGSWWAYYELGWGGWWFWDPVENLSLLPWLLATALLHSMRKPNALTNYLAIGTFISGIVGTFFVRSGVLQSVHSFAADLNKGLYLFVFFVCLVIGSSIFYYYRYSYGYPLQIKKVSKDNGWVKVIQLNPLILVSIYATILVATIAPVIWSYFFNQSLSLGAPFFNHAILPLLLCMFALLIFIAERYTVVGWVNLLVFGLSFVTLVIFLMGDVFWDLISGLDIASILFGCVVLILGLTLLRTGVYSFRKDQKIRSGLFVVSHFSLVIIGVSIIISSCLEFESISFMVPGDQIRLGDFVLTFRGVNHIEGPTYHSLYGSFVLHTFDPSVNYDMNHLATLFPEKRFYLTNGVFTSKSAIYSNLLGDISVLIGDGNLSSGWYVRASFKPLMAWLWLGSALLAISGTSGLWRKVTKPRYF